MAARAERTEAGHWRCLKNCFCGHSVEAWGKTGAEAHRNAVAKLDLHHYDQHQKETKKPS